jgi:hypothetical protein
MAAGNTYEAIATVTGSNSSPEVSFTSIPSTYTDLILVSNVNPSNSASAMGIYFNGSTATNYSVTFLKGDGSAAASSRLTSQVTYPVFGTATLLPTTPSNVITSFMNYSNTTTFKTAISRMNYSNVAVGTSVGLWRVTDAINQITISTLNGSYFWTTASTFTLYGIASA